MDLISLLFWLAVLAAIFVLVAIVVSDCDLTLLYADKYGREVGMYTSYPLMHCHTMCSYRVCVMLQRSFAAR